MRGRCDRGWTHAQQHEHRPGPPPPSAALRAGPAVQAVRAGDRLPRRRRRGVPVFFHPFLSVSAQFRRVPLSASPSSKGTSMKLNILVKLALCCAMSATCLVAQAQSSNPVKLLVGFPPGGSMDALARMLAEKLQVSLGRTVIVENKPGANGRLAIESLATAGPDTYLVAPVSSLIFPVLTTPGLRYDIFKDMKPVAGLTSVSLGVAVNTKIGVNDAKELVAWLKAHPNEAQFGTGGLGGQNHFIGLQFGKVTGVNMNVVAYKGNAPVLTDLMAGHIPMGIFVMGEAAAHARGGRVRVVGVMTSKRSPVMPDVPTMTEQGIPLEAGEAWYGMWTPATASKAEVDKMEDAVKKALASPEVRDGIENKYFMSVDYRSAEQATKRMRGEYDFWQPLVKSSGFKPE
jgi:tripartite-type tricarboxylate transporter receptor subunit TctC